MELDKALRFAVILAWEDLMRVANTCSARVEYRSESGTTLDHLRVWSDRAKGYQDLVCDYWTCASPAHPDGAAFKNDHHSDRLAQTLDFIMKNQDRFTRPAGTSPNGLVLIYPPAGDDRTEAAAWWTGVSGIAADFGGVAEEKAVAA